MRALVIDDSNFMRKVVSAELEKIGLEIAEASNGKEAIDFLESQSVDLITIDVEMPELDGFETCKRIREMKIDTPVIFVTDVDRIEAREKGFQAGATDFISKKYIPGELSLVAEEILSPKNLDLTGHKVLVAEDCNTTRKHLVDLLRRCRAEVLEAADGDAALAIFKEENIDLLVTDQEMPGIVGTELTRTIRRDLGDRVTPIIFLTGRNRDEIVTEIFACGATDYLPKPLLSEEFKSRVGTHLKASKLFKDFRGTIDTLSETVAKKDQIVSICAHDLKTPLNGILGFLELLDDEPVNAEVKEYLDLVSCSANLMSNLIDSILQYSQIQNSITDLPMAEVNLQEVVDESILLSRAAREKKTIEVKVNVHGNPFSIAGDKLSLVRVVNNLLSNAIKFSPVGSRIDANIYFDPDSVKLEIADQGTGIPEATQAKLFQPFSYSGIGTSGETGTGLGLSIVKEIIDGHHGEVKCKKSGPDGTTFAIELKKGA